MYGEDVDFTCAIARLGYRVVDRHPGSLLRGRPQHPGNSCAVQRTRWNRGGTMAYARYIPIVTGLCRTALLVLRHPLGGQAVPGPAAHHHPRLRHRPGALPTPTTHLNLARVAFILLFKAVPALVQVTACTIYYGKARHLGWLPLRYAFVLLKHYYGLEAFLSFNARPVITARMAEALRPPMRRDVK